MKKLVLNNFYQMNEKCFTGVITFQEYVDLIKEGYIQFNQDINGFHRAKALAYNYNSNDDIKKVDGFSISLFVENNNKNKAELKENKLFISCDCLDVTEGIFKSLTILELDNRFMDSKLMITIYYCSEKEVKELLT